MQYKLFRSATNSHTNSMQHNPSEQALSCSVSPSNYPHFLKA